MTIPHHGETTSVKKRERMAPNGLLEDELANFMLEKKSHAKGIGDMLVQQPNSYQSAIPRSYDSINAEGAKVLKDLLSHKEKLEKATSLVKLIKNALIDLGASINLMPHSLFRRLGISKTTKMSIQFADRSIKYPIRVCENLLVKVSKFIFPIDFVVLEMDEDELVPIILGWPFLATARAVIDVHVGKLSLRVRNETITFNIENSMKSKHSRDDYLYCADHTAKLVQEQWVDTVNHDGKWTEDEEEEDSNKALAVSFYPRTKPVESLEWKISKNRLKPSSVEPPDSN
ncbi:DNA-directed DNA polymerase [Tanacetum coccineum]